MTDLLSNPLAASVTAPTRDFTRPRTRLTFTIDGEMFEAAPTLPGDIYAQFVTLGESEADTYEQQHEQIKQALELALMPESWERFASRLKDKTNPIDDDQTADVALWLMEAYGMRPTKPSQPSSDGSPTQESGMSSTDAQPPQASTQEVSLPTAS